MKAWRFYGFGDMRLDDVPEPVCRPGHVIVEPLCVQPSVTEAQLAFGIPTLAYDQHQAPARDRGPGAALRPRVLRPGRRDRRGRDAVPAGRPRGGAGEAAVRQLPALPERRRATSAARARSSASSCPAASPSGAVLAGDRAGEGRRPHLRQRGRLPAIAQRQRRGRRDGRDRDRRLGRDLRPGQHGPGVPADRPQQRRGAAHHRGRARRGVPHVPRTRRRPRPRTRRNATRSRPSAT